MKRTTILLILLSAFITGFAQMHDPVKWSHKLKKVDANNYEMAVKAVIQEGWHIYSMKLPENTAIPTTFTFEKNENVELIGGVKADQKVHEVFDKAYEAKIGYYEKEVTFTQKFKTKSTAPLTFKGSVEFMSCNDGNCLPPDTYDFESKIGGGAATEVAKKVAAKSSEETTSKNETVVKKKESKDDDQSLLGFFITAFLAGLVALLTPCIYPMIPMTASFFMHGSENKAKAKFNAITYGVSIILIFLAFGSIVSVTLGESFSNEMSTHWLPNIFFFILFMVFAASFFGMFELTLPSWIVNKSDKQADKGGILGPFFMAFTLVLVSFSCTAPFVGTVLGLSVDGEFIKPIVGMLGYSLAFAFPFTFFALFPSLIQKLPKSGGWMNSVKVVIGFIEVALAFKFLSAADQTYGWGLLDREIYLAIWITTFTLMGLYLIGKLKFSHDSDLPFISVPRIMLAIATFSFVVYLIPGMFGAPLKSLAGWLPPQSSIDFNLPAMIKSSGSNVVHKSSDKKYSCGTPKYKDRFKGITPSNLSAYYDYDQAIECAREQNKPLFIDFTGLACVNCRNMDDNVIVNPKILNYLNEEYVVVALYVDDKKIKLPKDKQYVDSRGKTINTLGKRNFDLQKTKFGVNAQPYYVLLDNEEKVLTGNGRGYNLDVDSFYQFLKDGVDEFRSKK